MHALLDLSNWSGADWSRVFHRLRQPDSLGGLATDVTCIVPKGAPQPAAPASVRWRWATAPGLDAACEALNRAGRADVHLLVLFAPLASCAEAAVSLTAAFDDDPMFGAAHPRFAVDGGAAILPASGNDGSHRPFPRSALSALSPRYILPEYLTHCFVLRRDLVANLEPLAPDSETAAELLQEYLRRARRIGYRSVVVNSVVVALPKQVSPREAELVTPTGDPTQSWDSDVARARFSRRSDLDREQRVAALYERPRRLLIDARNLNATINGTSKALLGLADGLRRIETGWNVTMAASLEAAEAHDLERRYEPWAIVDAVPAGPFAVAFRPSQPWDLSELIDLHRVAAVNAYLVLDTIAWDVVYTAPRRLDPTWRFAAQYADALLFISEFSRQRFFTRFQVHPAVRTPVCHLSLDPADYVDPTAAAAAGNSRYWFVIGNEYDHKHVQPTLSLLARAFPTTKLVVLGSSANGGGIASVASGRTSEHDVQKLYAGAELVIFPSFYEGFGIPVVNALAYGKTVVARDSALLREIVDAYAGPGRIVPFSTTDDLVERLSRLRHGLAVPELALHATRPATNDWNRAAHTVQGCLRALAEPGAVRREADRHETVVLLGAWAGED